MTRFSELSDREQMYIKKCWMKKDAFKRYAQMTDDLGYGEEDYKKWFENQMNELEHEDCKFILDLCTQMRRHPFNIMDLESCAIFSAGFLFFSISSRLVIANFR